MTGVSDTVIRVENLGKKYIIGHQQQGRSRYTALRDVLTNGAKSVGRRILNPFAQQPPSATREEFWALKDVSFEIKQGDRVGIIGRNGAGKSTLLKLLSRITEPTTGRISVKGRVASLLEVGTGFHPELTGRENIYLNGAILGMSKAEIKKKFDEIVDFAEVEKFLDTPVKYYSSGMYVRLAFAVASYLESEILIVDEVLAVGDTQFQEKCFGKMEDITRSGKTVLFVSHNLAAVKSLCQRGLLIEQGGLAADSAVSNIIESYLSQKTPRASVYLAIENKSIPYFEKIEISQPNALDKVKNIFAIDKPILIQFTLNTCEKKEVGVSVVIRNTQDIWIHHSSDEFGEIDKSSSRRQCYIPAYSLAPGKYYIDAFIHQRNIESFETIKDVLEFEVEFTGRLSNMTNATDWRGLCGPGLLIWKSIDELKHEF